jgi:hypothetical protein
VVVVDELGLVETDRGLDEGVVQGVADGADGGGRCRPERLR